MKQFKQSCFVRVEDSDKRKVLCDYLAPIGYKIKVDCTDELNPILVASKLGIAYDASEFEGVPGFIDCGTNIELFKAIAAINDEDDNMQWFVDKRTGEISTKCIGSFKYPFLAHTNYRKATPEELIEHFKNQ